MNLLHLRYFYEVARTQSFTDAARALRVSQPAISKMVKLLESDLGVTLLERDRRGMRLTDRGEILFHSASRIFGEAAAAQEALRSGPGELTGEWSLGASDNLAVYVLPRVVGKFKESNPRLRISVFAATSSEIKSELHHDRCRLGMFFTPIAASEPFESLQVHETEFWVVLSRRNRWFAAGRKVSLDDLKKAGTPRLESRQSDYSGEFPARFHSTRLGFHSAPWLEVNQHEVKKRLVMEGFGFALLTRHTVEAEVDAGQLIRVPTSRKLVAPVYAAWKKGRPRGTATDRFLETLQEHLRDFSNKPR